MIARSFQRLFQVNRTNYRHIRVLLNQNTWAQQVRYFSGQKMMATNKQHDESEFTYAQFLNDSNQNQNAPSYSEEKPQFKLIITDLTVQKIKQLHSKDESKKYLKIFVDSGGCSGFQYNFKMVDSLEENELVFEKDGAHVIVDETTLEFINGSIIDYKKEMIRQSFEVVENPNAELGCSCGTSFAPKDK